MGGLAVRGNGPLVAGAGGKADGQADVAMGLGRAAQAKGQVGLGEGLGMEKGLEPVVPRSKRLTGWGAASGGK